MSGRPDAVVRLAASTEEPDAIVSIVGDQVLTAMPADVGKVVTVAADGTLTLAVGGGAGSHSHVEGDLPAALINETELGVAIDAHGSDATNVHGIVDTSALATSAAVATAVSDHSADATSVHGIADTSVLATTTDLTGKVSTTGGGREGLVAGGNSGAAATISLASGNVVAFTLTANCTFTFPTVVNDGAYSFTLVLVQDGTGSRTATWPAAVKWPAASAPTLTTTASRRDVLTFVTYDGGTTWLGFVAGQNYV